MYLSGSTQSSSVLGRIKAVCQLGQGAPASLSFCGEHAAPTEPFPPGLLWLRLSERCSPGGESPFLGKISSLAAFSPSTLPNRPAILAFLEVVSHRWLVLSVLNHLPNLSSVSLADWPGRQSVGPCMGIQEQIVPSQPHSRPP